MGLVWFLFGWWEMKDVGVFEEVIGKVGLWRGKCGGEIVKVVVGDLWGIEMGVNLDFE